MGQNREPDGRQPTPPLPLPLFATHSPPHRPWEALPDPGALDATLRCDPRSDLRQFGGWQDFREELVAFGTAARITKFVEGSPGRLGKRFGRQEEAKTRAGA